MRIRITDPSLIPDLVAFLRDRLDAVVEPVGDREVEVNLIGSYGADAMRMELELRIRAWEAARGTSGLVAVLGVAGDR
jgi:hypothetical protein